MRLDLLGVTVTYGDVQALHQVTATIEGRVLGLLGANGSGKTSLLRVLAGVAAADRGQALMDGQEIRLGRLSWISYLPQETGFFPFLQRPLETLTLSMHFRGIVDPEAPHHILAALGLEDEDRSAAGFSGGMKQKLRIAQALVHAPRLLLLDEPTTGLDARERFRVLRLIDRLRDRTAVIFSTHQPDDVAAVCDQVLILHAGRGVAAGAPDAITAAAEGHVYEVTLRSVSLPADPAYTIVRADREGDVLQLRLVGSPPAGARPVSPRLEDAYLVLTAGSGG